MAQKWFEKNTEKGVLKYRLPNIEEGFEFLSSVERIQSLQDAYKVKGKFVPKMKFLIDYGSIGYKSWEEFLDDKDNNFVAVAEIADEIFVDIVKVLGKKNSSPTP